MDNVSGCNVLGSRKKKNGNGKPRIPHGPRRTAPANAPGGRNEQAPNDGLGRKAKEKQRKILEQEALLDEQRRKNIQGRGRGMKEARGGFDEDEKRAQRERAQQRRKEKYENGQQRRAQLNPRMEDI